MVAALLAATILIHPPGRAPCSMADESPILLYDIESMMFYVTPS
jgi:hypothetical protein